jgi:DNA-binding transcriptional LysR family regulator
MSSLPQLESFVEVVQRGSLSRAAETLFVTQPALTARLQRLEQELGAELFVRSRRGMRLTEAGRAFLPYAERALAAVGDGKSAVSDLARGGRGHIAIGAAPAVSTYVLPSILKRFRNEHPQVAFSVRTGHSEEVVELVLSDRVDVGLVRAVRHPEITSVPLYEDKLVLVVEPDHRFAADRTIRLEAIADEQLILFDRTSSYHHLTSALFREAGVTPRGLLELDNIDATKKMVQEGLGVAFLPQTACVGELADGTLRAVAIKDADTVRRQIVAVRRRSAGPPSRIVGAFLRTLRRLAPT